MSRKRLLLFGVTLIIVILLVPAPARFSTLLLGIAIGGTVFLPRTKLQRAIGIFICFCLFFASGMLMIGDIILNNLAAAPTHHWEAPAELVGLGGQQITLYAPEKATTFTVCYWLENGALLAAAHNLSGFVPAGVPVHLGPPAPEAESVSAKVLANSDDGLALGLPSDYAPPTTPCPIGATTDLIADTEAEIISDRGGSFPVIIRGFLNLSNQSIMLIESLNAYDIFIPGMSGSPVVQDGKIIGFMVGSFRGNKNVAFCRLAAELYASNLAAMQEYDPDR